MSEDGILLHALLPDLWRDNTRYPPKEYPALLEILREAGILFPLSEKASLVPCLLPSVVPNMEYLWVEGGEEGGVEGDLVRLFEVVRDEV